MPLTASQQMVDERIKKVMGTFIGRLTKGFAQKDFITFRSTGIRKNVWASTFTELAVAKHLNQGAPEKFIIVPTEIMTDRKRALQLNREMSTDIVARTCGDDGRWKEGHTRIDVKLQDRSLDFGTFNVEWSVDGDTRNKESNIHHSKCTHYCYVCQGKAYLISKEALYELAKSLPTHTNKAGYNRKFQTKWVKIEDVEAACVKVFDLGEEYREAMNTYYDVA